MEQFLPGLLHDLDRTCHVLKERLDAADLPDEVATQANRAYAVVENAHRDVRELLEADDLGEPSFLRLHLQMLRRSVERVSIVEGSILPAIERFDSPDRLATRLCARLALEVQWPIPPPLVTTISASYYWCFPQVNMVFIPTAEDASHLGMPDLCHEMAHVLLESFPDDLLGDFLARAAKYVDSLRQRVDAGELPAEWRWSIDGLAASWSQDWYRELVPDIVATYVIGPPYGWQHLRLSSRLSANPYYPALGQSLSHPADDARLRCITATLRALGGSREADALQAVWDGYANATRRKRQLEYELAYPVELLDLLVGNVVSGCVRLKIRGYHRPRRRVPGDIVQMLRDLWIAFLADPQKHFKRDRLRFRFGGGR